MKTPIQKEYVRRLANLNDQFCFFLFNREELNQKLSNYTDKANPLYTTYLFSKNQYAPKIHVTFEKLPEFQEQNETLNFGAYFSFTYEFFSSYIDDVITIVEEINGVSLTASEQRKEPEKRLKKIISKSGYTPPAQEIFDTISYCRLRRNYFTHVLDSLNSKFQDIVNNKGAGLNAYWSGARNSLDFTQTSVDQFEENETLELLKIQRILLETIDQFIGGILNKVGIAEYLSNQAFSKPTRINEDVVKKRKTKIASLSKNHFGVTLTDADMNNAVRTIGKKLNTAANN